MRSMKENCTVTENTNNLILFCLFTGLEPIGFEEVVRDKKNGRKPFMRRLTIEKNGTWELTTLPKGD